MAVGRGLHSIVVGCWPLLVVAFRKEEILLRLAHKLCHESEKFSGYSCFFLFGVNFAEYTLLRHAIDNKFLSLRFGG